MTPEQFMQSIAPFYSRKLTPLQRQAYLRALEPLAFSDKLDKLAEQIPARCKQFPSVATIFEVAEKHVRGAKRQSLPTDKPHRWETTDCHHCQGEGVITVFWTHMYQIEPYMRDELTEPVVFPNSSREVSTYRRQHRLQVQTLFRCSCPAGQAETIPSAWPRWDGRQIHRRSIHGS